MKQDIFIRIYAIVLTIAVLVTSASAVQIAKVYAEEGEEIFTEETEILEEELQDEDYQED